MLQKVGELSGGAVQIPSFPMDHHNVTGVIYVLDIQKTNILAEQMPKGGRLGSDGDARRNLSFLNAVAIILSLLFAALVIYILLAMVLPQVYESVVGLVQSIPR